VIAGTCPEGTSFADARSPVRLFFLLCASADVPHLRLLQLVSRLVRVPDAVDQLVACEDATRFIDSIVALETRAGQGEEKWS
jgi:mannitol/fructose-specific phosphotransferase system IIA component (Ntr-type)